MISNEVLAVIGALITIGLTINAFFIKSLISEIKMNGDKTSSIDKNLAILTSESKSTERRLTLCEDRLRLIDEFGNETRRAVHDKLNDVSGRIGIMELKIEGYTPARKKD